MSDSSPNIKRIELKYQLDARLAAQVRDWAREHLGVDEYCDDGSDSYDISTLYLDTPAFDLFHRTGVVGNAKYRIRRYGLERVLWIETKRKKKMVVRKNRTAVVESELMERLTDCPIAPNLCAVHESAASLPIEKEPEASWPGDWFLQRIADLRLQPAIQIGYRRFARTSTIDGRNLRLTIDSDLAAGPVGGWQVSSQSRRTLGELADREILELKFHNYMPPLFKDLLRTFSIPATGFSKYRTGMISRNAPLPGLLCQGSRENAQPPSNAERLANA